jgi:hypothetical protein
MGYYTWLLIDIARTGELYLFPPTLPHLGAALRPLHLQRGARVRRSTGPVDQVVRRAVLYEGRIRTHTLIPIIRMVVLLRHISLARLVAKRC